MFTFIVWTYWMSLVECLNVYKKSRILRFFIMSYVFAFSTWNSFPLIYTIRVRNWKLKLFYKKNITNLFQTLYSTFINFNLYTSTIDVYSFWLHICHTLSLGSEIIGDSIGRKKNENKEILVKKFYSCNNCFVLIYLKLNEAPYL